MSVLAYSVLFYFLQLQSLRHEQLRLQEEVSEKNKLIRFQQLKIVDMRKALNKELVSPIRTSLKPEPPEIGPTGHCGGVLSPFLQNQDTQDINHRIILPVHSVHRPLKT